MAQSIEVAVSPRNAFRFAQFLEANGNTEDIPVHVVRKLLQSFANDGVQTLRASVDAGLWTLEVQVNDVKKFTDSGDTFGEALVGASEKLSTFLTQRFLN